MHFLDYRLPYFSLNFAKISEIISFITYFVFIAALTAGNAKSANVSVALGHHEMNCIIHIEGEIVNGDADRVKRAISEIISNKGWVSIENRPAQGEFRICLDSPGGSYSEAIKIGDILVFGVGGGEILKEARLADPTGDERYLPISVLALGTAVPENAKCLSACSIIFMAGGFFDNVGIPRNMRNVDRVMHITASLGFHSPYFGELPERIYTKADIENAFMIGQQVYQDLSERMKFYRIPSELLLKMFSTSRDEMFFLTTVGEAARWDISLTPAPRFNFLTDAMVENICENIQDIQYIWHSNRFYPKDVSSSAIPYIQMSEPTWGLGWGQKLIPSSNIKIIDERIAAIGRNVDCEFYFDISTQMVSFSLFGGSRFFNLFPNDARMAWAFLPGYTELKFLEELVRNYKLIDSNIFLMPFIDKFLGTCDIIQGRDLVDRFYCEVLLTSNLSLDGKRGSLEVCYLRDGADEFYGCWDPVSNDFIGFRDIPTGKKTLFSKYSTANVHGYSALSYSFEQFGCFPLSGAKDICNTFSGIFSSDPELWMRN